MPFVKGHPFYKGGEKGWFKYRGGGGKTKDKECPDCKKIIRRDSLHCRSCSQSKKYKTISSESKEKMSQAKMGKHPWNFNTVGLVKLIQDHFQKTIGQKEYFLIH